MIKSYSNLRSLVFVCAVFLLSNFYSFSAFGQCNSAANDASFNSLDIEVGINYHNGGSEEIIPLSNGKILIGGALRLYDNQEVKGIIRINEDGSLDNTFNSLSSSDFNDFSVFRMKVDNDGKIFIAGTGTSASFENKYIVRLNEDGLLDNSFNVVDFEVNSVITAFDIQSDGKIIVGGRLRIGGRDKNIVRLNSDGSLDNTFVDGKFVSNPSVNDIVVLDDDKFLIGGAFNGYNGVLNTGRSRLMRLDRNGNVDLSFNQYRAGITNGGVANIIVYETGKILVSGYVKKYNYIDIADIVRLNPDGSLDTSFSSSLDVSTNSYSSARSYLQGDKIIVNRGQGNTPTPNIIRLNSDGSIDPSFSHFENRRGSRAFAVLPNGKILTGYGTTNAIIDRHNPNGDWDNTFKPSYGFDKNVEQSVLFNNRLYVYGNFGRYNNQQAYQVAKINIDGSLDNSFKLNVFDFQMRGIEVQQDEKVLLLGKFFFGYTSPTNIIRVNQNGSFDSNFNATAAFDPAGAFTASAYDAVVQSDGKIICVGDFTSSNGSNSIVRLNTDGTIDGSFSTTGADDKIETVHLQDDGKIIITGNFRNYNGTPSPQIARILPNGSIDPTFNFDMASVLTIEGVEKVKIIDNTSILVALRKFNNTIELRKVDLFGAIDPSFTTTFGGNVNTNIYDSDIHDIIVQDNGEIVVVGEFEQVNNMYSKNIVGLSSDGSTNTVFNTGIGTDKAIRNVHQIQSENSLLITGDFTNYNTVVRNHIAKLRSNTNNLTNTTPSQSQYRLCLGATTVLQATGQGTIYWYDNLTSNIPITTGNSFTTPALTADSTYFYAQDSIVGCGVSPRLEILVTTIQGIEAVSKTNYIAYLDETGQIEVNAALLDSLSATTCGSTITSFLFDDTNLATRSFSCADTNALHNVILRVTDDNGNTDTSFTIIQVKDTLAPIVFTRVLPVIFVGTSNQTTILARDFIYSMSDNCTDSTDLNVVFEDTGLENKIIPCSTNAPRLYRVRVTDQNGNFVIKRVDISFSSNPYDFNVNIIANTFRPVVSSTITVIANNYSCVPKSGELKVTLPADVAYNSASIAPANIIGNDLYWNVTDLNYDRSFVVRVSVTPDINLNVGDSVCFTGHTTPEANDINISNNLKTYCFPVVNSYDPNDKQVYPQGICDDKFTKRSDLPLTYTIRFQNTGNAPALNVNIVDSLSNLLDRSSLRVVGSSHPMVVDTTANNNNNINFVFNNINLPDSTSSPELSQGYVIFELDEIAAHTDTSRIENKSYIYFDTNAPIITNTVKNTILDVLPLCDPAGGSNPPIADCQLPTNLTAEALSATKAKLSWTTPANSNAINYEIWRNNQLLETVVASQLSFVDSLLNPSTQYTYSIKAICGNNTATSNFVQVRTIPSTPTLFSLEAACKGETGTIEVRSNGAVYRVYASQNAASPLFETNNATIQTPALNDTTTFYISVVVNSLESERLEVVVPIKEVFEAIVEQGSLFETCTNTFTLSANEVENASYLWFRGNIQVGNTRALVVSFEGNYTVRIEREGCFAVSEATKVVFVDAPTAKIEQGSEVSFCGNGMLNAQDTSSNVTYTWSLNGTDVGTGTSISVSESGNYTLTASQPSCLDSVSIAVTITDLPAMVLAADKTEICSSEETTLSVTTGTGFTYKWFRNQTAISNDSSTLVTSEIGTYKVEITTTEGCQVESNEVEITEAQAPDATITINKENSVDKTITVSSSDSIVAVVWFKDGSEISSFNNQKTIQPTESGSYKAKVTYVSGCEFETEEKVFTFDIATGIEEESAKIFTVYPNPNTGSFKIEFATTTNQKTNLVVVDALGRTIYSKEISRNEKTTNITLPKISAGVYVVQIVSQGKVYTKQLVIQ